MELFQIIEQTVKVDYRKRCDISELRDMLFRLKNDVK